MTIAPNCEDLVTLGCAIQAYIISSSNEVSCAELPKRLPLSPVSLMASNSEGKPATLIAKFAPLPAKGSQFFLILCSKDKCPRTHSDPLSKLRLHLKLVMPGAKFGRVRLMEKSLWSRIGLVTLVVHLPNVAWSWGVTVKTLNCFFEHKLVKYEW